MWDKNVIRKCIHEKCKKNFDKKKKAIQTKKWPTLLIIQTQKYVRWMLRMLPFEMIVNKLLAKIDEKKKYSNHDSSV